MPEQPEEIHPDDESSGSSTSIKNQDKEFESVEVEGCHVNAENAPGTSRPWYQEVRGAAMSLKNRHFPKPDVMIAVMGKTGTGKTSFINAITGGSMEIGHGLRACEFYLADKLWIAHICA